MPALPSQHHALLTQHTTWHLVHLLNPSMSAHERPSAHRPLDDHVLVTLTLHALHRPPDDHVLVCGGLSQAVNSALQIRIHTPQVHVVVLCGLMPKRNSIQLDEWEEKLSPLLQHDEEHVRSRRRRTL